MLVYVVTAQKDLAQQWSTVLQFVGETVELLQPDECMTAVQRSTSAIVLIPDASVSKDIATKLPGTPFIGTHNHPELHECVNCVGILPENYQYFDVIQLLYRAQQYHAQKPQEQENQEFFQKEEILASTLVGQSPAMLAVRKQILQVAPTNANVLILGESGTGKEVIAQGLHRVSSRSKGPFVPVNCGAIPAELLESELFGHEKGAFTGAIGTRKGRFELAEGGTIFLDEIGDMPLPMQVKLLRIIQEREFERVGGNKTIKADVRIIAATHQGLERMIEEGKFRQDLFYRLHVFPIDVPALREREGDIPLLIHELVQRLKADKKINLRFTEAALHALAQYTWSGNVRELSNLVERLSITHPASIIDVADLPSRYQSDDAQSYQPDYPEELRERDALQAIFSDDDDVLDDILYPAGSGLVPQRLPEEGLDLKALLGELEVDLIKQALEQQDWVVARAAEQLGMRRTTLVEKIKKYGIEKEY